MRSKTLFATVFIAVSATAASAQAGCGQGNRLGSDNGSNGINAIAPSRAVTNPCSSLYRNGIDVRRREKRLYPNAVVRH